MLQNESAARKAVPLPAEYADSTTLKPLFVPVHEYLRLLGLGRTVGFQYLREGKVRSVLAGRKRLVLYSDCERLMLAALNRGSL